MQAAHRSGPPAELRADVRQTALESFSRRHGRPRTGEAERALAWFLEATAGGEPWQRVQRALTLHMLAAHAPAFSARARLAPLVDEATAALAAVPRALTLDLHPMDALGRLQASWVEHERGVPGAIDAAGLANYLHPLAQRQTQLAWLMTEIAAQVGVPRVLTFPVRPFKGRSRLQDLYWLVHEVLLDTRFLARPLPPRGWETRTEELALGLGDVLAEKRIELAAELALALQAAGEEMTAVHDGLIALAAAHQEPTGRVVDPPSLEIPDGPSRDRRLVVSTASALLAFAHTTEDLSRR